MREVATADAEPSSRRWPDAWIEGIGVRGPGLDGWPATRDVLRGAVVYRKEPTVLVAPPALPPAERRRVGKSVKLAIDVGLAACEHAGRDASTLTSVFTSSSGDGDNCDAICRSLTGDRLISPTRFHNSVHNAPSGYWGIASRSHAPSTSLCAFDASFAAGLVDAWSHLVDGSDAVLLVAYDAPYPAPLFATRPVPDAFGVALVLAGAQGPRAIARLSMGAGGAAIDRTTDRVDDPMLDEWRRTIPAARALPLLAVLASIDAAREDDDASRARHAHVVRIDDVHDRPLVLTVHDETSEQQDLRRDDRRTALLRATRRCA